MRYIAILLALLGWLFCAPFTAAYDEKPEQQLEFRIDPDLAKPKVVLGPYPSEYKAPRALRKSVASKTITRVTKFGPGYCTDYVARKVPVTWSGNAGRWAENARAQGYLVDKNPVAGGILVTNESRIGHVAYIEFVEGTKITFTEWNYAGRYKLTQRTLDISSPLIKGIIHI